MLSRIKDVKHFVEATAATALYRYPARKLVVVGVTGTDGKTTTVNLITHILNFAKYKAASYSTLSSTHTTTPNTWRMQKFLSEAAQKKLTHVVLEVSSHGIAQRRIAGIKFAVGVLTNIANNEHLDYHKTFENYRDTKLGFLLQCPTIVANADDPSIKFLQDKLTNQNLITYSIKSPSTVKLTKASYSTKGTIIRLEGYVIKTKLLGEFNVYNILAAVSTAKALQISSGTIVQALQEFEPLVGRVEIVPTESFTSIIDFAHTPQAFQSVVPLAKTFVKDGGKLIHVFGATGDRDKSKRPLLAKIASEHADVIVLTHEDTYTENLQAIVKEVETGLDSNQWIDGQGKLPNKKKLNKYYKIYDRKEAIQKAVSLAAPGDVVLLTGLGHQRTMNINGKEIPINEKEVLQEAVNGKAT